MNKLLVTGARNTDVLIKFFVVSNQARDPLCAACCEFVFRQFHMVACKCDLVDEQVTKVYVSSG
jgi:hypothetical protein